MTRVLALILLLTIPALASGQDGFTMDGQQVELINVKAPRVQKRTSVTTPSATDKTTMSKGSTAAVTATFPVTVVPNVNFDPSVLKPGYRASGGSPSKSYGESVQKYLSLGLLFLVAGTTIYLVLVNSKRR